MTSQLRALIESDLLFMGAALYVNKCNGSKSILIWADSINLRYPGKIQTHDRQKC